MGKRSSRLRVENASFCFRKPERFIVMLIWASTLQTGVFTCLWRSVQKYISNGYLNPRDTFDVFLRYRARIYFGLKADLPVYFRLYRYPSIPFGRYTFLCNELRLVYLFCNLHPIFSPSFVFPLFVTVQRYCL